jgi:hypothetical protein
MSDVFAFAGGKLFIGGALAPANNLTASSFSGQSGLWTECKPLESISAIGDTSQEVTFDDVASSRTFIKKGSRRGSTMNVRLGWNNADQGQAALATAMGTNLDYAFKVVFSDAPAGGTPSERMFVGQVGSFVEEPGDANSIVRVAVDIRINSNVVRVAAAPGGGG